MKIKLCCGKQETYLRAIVNIFQVYSTSTNHAEQTIYNKNQQKKYEKETTYKKGDMSGKQEKNTKNRKNRKKDPV